MTDRHCFRVQTTGGKLPSSQRSQSDPRQSDELSKLLEYVSGNLTPHHTSPFHPIHSNSQKPYPPDTAQTYSRLNFFHMRTHPVLSARPEIGMSGCSTLKFSGGGWEKQVTGSWMVFQEQGTFLWQAKIKTNYT